MTTATTTMGTVMAMIAAWLNPLLVSGLLLVLLLLPPLVAAAGHTKLTKKFGLYMGRTLGDVSCVKLAC